MDAPPVQYVKTSDGYSIAYAVTGKGRPVVLLPGTFNHIQLSWTEETFMRPWLEGLAARFQLIQYDGRGQGMSTRGLGPNFSMSDLITDLEAVTERAGVDRCVLIGRTFFGHAAIRYAILHPDRVEALVLVSVPVLGSALTEVWTIAAQKSWDLLLSIATYERSGDNARSRWRLMQTINLDDYVTMLRRALSSDVRDILPQVRVPTLVLHPREYLLRPPEEPMELAAGIDNARFHLVSGDSPFGDPVESLALVDDFLAQLRASEAERQAQTTPEIGLSSREMEVLRLLAAGKSNGQIAKELVISVRTAERHVANIYAKLNIHSKAEATALAVRSGLV